MMEHLKNSLIGLKEIKNFWYMTVFEMCPVCGEERSYRYRVYGIKPKEIEKRIYAAETTWYGEVYSTRWTAEDTGMDEKEWEEFKEKTPKCVVLEPVN